MYSSLELSFQQARQLADSLGVFMVTLTKPKPTSSPKVFVAAFQPQSNQWCIKSMEVPSQWEGDLKETVKQVIDKGKVVTSLEFITRLVTLDKELIKTYSDQDTCRLLTYKFCKKNRKRI